MVQLCFPFGSERTLAFRNITPDLESQPYLYTGWRQRKFDFTIGRRCGGYSRHKKSLFKGRESVSCCYCEKELSYEEATVEHILPRSKGGGNFRNNVTIACGPCNHHRGDYSFSEWKSMVQSALFQRTREGGIHIYANRYMAFYAYLKKRGRLVERRYLK